MPVVTNIRVMSNQFNELTPTNDLSLHTHTHTALSMDIEHCLNLPLKKWPTFNRLYVLCTIVNTVLTARNNLCTTAT